MGSNDSERASATRQTAPRERALRARPPGVAHAMAGQHPTLNDNRVMHDPRKRHACTERPPCQWVRLERTNGASCAKALHAARQTRSCCHRRPRRRVARRSHAAQHKRRAHVERGQTRALPQRSELCHGVGTASIATTPYAVSDPGVRPVCSCRRLRPASSRASASSALRLADLRANGYRIDDAPMYEIDQKTNIFFPVTRKDICVQLASSSGSSGAPCTENSSRSGSIATGTRRSRMAVWHPTPTYRFVLFRVALALRNPHRGTTPTILQEISTRM